MLIIYLSLILVSLVNRISLPVVIIPPKASKIVRDPLTFPKHFVGLGVEIRKTELPVPTFLNDQVGFLLFPERGFSGFEAQWKMNSRTFKFLHDLTLHLSWLQISLSALQLFFYLDLLLFLDRKEEWQDCSLEVCFGK